ncbi:pYEATS domain-containing protein [Tenacibaculum sp. TC6]|uniref:pYEATS domain-containing protein n=1 Tax=Tenacibaculum sp. TC6 TaxID=3423223 RepID=UPI003D366EC0
MRQKTYDLRVKDSLFNPDERSIKGIDVAYYKKQNKEGITYYKVHLYIDGMDLAFVKKVTYILHKSFKNPVRTIERRPDNPHCKLILWTWGLFEIRVEIEDINGQKTELEHYLSYGKEIKEGNIKWTQA